MKKRYFLLSLLAAVPLLSQGVPPNNGFFTGREYFPWDQAKMQYCTFYKTVDIFTGAPKDVPAPNKSVSSFASVQAGSGYHVHSQGSRPYPTILTQTPSSGLTDLTGCVTYKWTSPGNLAGWITFQSASPGFPSGGVNSRYRYHDWGPNGSILSFVQYNESLAISINQPFGLHPDTRHNPSPQGGFDNARYGTPSSTGMMFRISEAYFALSAGMLQSPIALDVIRGSLPDGGMADNEVGATPYGPYISDPWQARGNEYHQLGVEWDIVNPISQANGDATAYLILERVIEAANCVFGQADQSGTPLSNLFGFWSGQPVVHIVCSEVGGKVQ